MTAASRWLSWSTARIPVLSVSYAGWQNGSPPTSQSARWPPFIGPAAWQSATSAVIAAVSCPHRAEAFVACRRLIDDLKHEVPIWKHQCFADGTQEWVGAC